MTLRAICVPCGKPKRSPFGRCRACGFTPETEYQMGRALIFSLTRSVDGVSIGRDPQTLEALSTQIRSGRFYEFDPREELRAVGAYRKLRDEDDRNRARRRYIVRAGLVLIGLLLAAALYELAA